MVKGFQQDFLSSVYLRDKSDNELRAILLFSCFALLSVWDFGFGIDLGPCWSWPKSSQSKFSFLIDFAFMTWIWNDLVNLRPNMLVKRGLYLNSAGCISIVQVLGTMVHLNSFFKVHLNIAGCTFLNTFAAHRHSSVLICQRWKLWPPICATNHSHPFPNRALSLVEIPGLRAVLPDFLSKHWEWAPPCSLKCRLAEPAQSCKPLALFAGLKWPWSEAWEFGRG